MTPRRLAAIAIPAVLLTPFVSACRDGARPTATVTVADTADQILFGMSYFVTVEGIRRARVQADTAYFHSATQIADLRTVRVTFFNASGAATSTLTCREGTYHWRTGDMEGRGAVRVVTTDGRRLSTEVLRYSQNRNEVTSDLPFVYDAPGRHVEGQGFTSDPDFQNVVAIKPTGSGGRFTLPNR